MIGRGVFIFCVTLCCATAIAQDSLRIPQLADVRFLDQDKNIIDNSVVLSSFYDKLYQLSKTKKGVINILHIGDSHIQADFLTHAVRLNFQKDFGNAGRGFIFPGRVARTNEPLTTFSSSSSPWEAKRVVFTNLPLPIGLSATTIQTTQPDAKFSIKVRDDGGMDYRFNTVSLFYRKDNSSFNVILKDSTGQAIAYAGPYTEEPIPNYSKVKLPYPVRRLELQVQQPTSTQNRFTFFGMAVANGNPGVLYHSIGGNGAKFRHYLEAQYFIEQTAALAPDLIIISLGTNEAIENPVDAKFSGQVESFIEGIKKNNPTAAIVITTPADFYRKKTRRNPGVEGVHTQLTAVAGKQNVAVWDLYTVAGGKHAADVWKKNKLMQADGVHFTRGGYELQGQLLYQAILKGYRDYVQYRYP